MPCVVGEQNSIANQFLAELRDKDVQLDRRRFRNNLQRLGEIMAYEISKKLSFVPLQVETPLGTSPTRVIANQPVLITILRAGLPYFEGFQNYFDKADCGFIGAYRKEDEEKITIHLEYLATPDLSGKEVILIDPMLATGKSVVEAVAVLQTHGKPARIHVASLVAAPEGLRFLEEKIKLPVLIWTFAVDEKLNALAYIVPGLGDAGDLSFGPKL